MKQVSPARKEILRFIASYSSVHGYSPTIREIGREVGLHSPATVKHHLDALRAEGMIQGGEHHARNISVVAELH